MNENDVSKEDSHKHFKSLIVHSNRIAVKAKMGISVFNIEELNRRLNSNIVLFKDVELSYSDFKYSGGKYTEDDLAVLPMYREDRYLDLESKNTKIYASYLVNNKTNQLTVHISPANINDTIVCEDFKNLNLVFKVLTTDKKIIWEDDLND